MDAPLRRRLSRRHGRGSSGAIDGPPLDWRKRQKSVLAVVLLFLGSYTSIFLAARWEQGSLGVFLLISGLVLIIFPPVQSIDWKVWCAVALFIGCGGLSFLPQSLFPTPVWRKTWESCSTISLAPTVTVEPRQTAFWLALVASSLVVGLFVLGQWNGSRDLVLIATLVLLSAACYGGLSIFAASTGWKGFLVTNAPFGFLPNRNHTASFLVLGAIVAAGVLGLPSEQRTPASRILAGVTVAVCIVALLFYSTSRAGVIFLGLGMALYVLGCGPARWRRPRFLVLSGAGLYAAIIFFAAGSEAQQRLLVFAGLKHSPLEAPAGAEPIPDARGDVGLGLRRLIFSDVLTLVHDHPLTGVGFGSFIPVFAHYRVGSLLQAQALHPESDWLMLAAETGWIGLLVFLLLLGLVLRPALTHRAHAFWPLRWAFILAALIAALHGIVDVPAHRVALGWWIMLLAAVGCQRRPTAFAIPTWRTRVAFASAGVVLLCFGAALFRAQWAGGAALPPFEAAAAGGRLYALFLANHWPEALREGERGLAHSPTADGLYYQMGALLLDFPAQEARAEEYFRGQRLLDPIFPGTPISQAGIWIKRDPDRVPPLWQDALLRQLRTDPGTGATLGLFRQLVAEAPGGSHLRSELWKMVDTALVPAAHEPVRASFRLDLCLAVLEGASRSDWDRVSHAVLDSDPDLATLSPRQRARFLRLWWQLGDREKAESAIGSHSGWSGQAWPVLAEALASRQQYQAAVDLVLGAIPAPRLPKVTERTLEDAIRTAAAAPKEFVAVYQLYDAQRRAGDSMGALDSLARLTAFSAPPAYLHYLQARAHGARGDWEPAWKALSGYLQAVPAVLPSTE